MFGSPETTPGGRALKFYSSVRLDIRRIESLKDGAEVVGNRTRVKVVKNKVSPPFRQAEFDIMYGKGISREGTLIDLSVDLGIVRKSGAWFTYEGEQLGQGRENAKTFLAENPEIMMEISDKVLTAAGLNPSDDVQSDAADRPRRRRCRRSDRLDRRSLRSACRARLTTPQAWSVVARNLPEHAGNAIHTDAGARAAGFPRALVAGVTTYAYLTHPIVAAWGLDWVAHGGGEVRFRSPVFEHDQVHCIPIPDPDDSGAVTVEAQCQPGDEPGVRALLRAVPNGAELRDLRAGEVLEPLVVELTGEWSADYGSRAGDDLSLYADHAIVHPAVWPALANRV